MLFYDLNGDGEIDYSEFLTAFKVPLNDFKKQLIKTAFDSLDTNQNGLIEPNELLRFEGLSDLDIVCGNKTKESHLEDWKKIVDTNEDGLISIKEFEDYYLDLSQILTSDSHFKQHIENTWGFKWGSGSQQTAELTLVEAKRNYHQMRDLILKMLKGTTDEFKLRQLFASYDIHKSRLLSVNQIAMIRKRLGLEDLDNATLRKLFHLIDKDESGFVEYPEFEQFLLKEPNF